MYKDVISASGVIVHLIGPVTISLNHAVSILYFESCEAIFYNSIMIKSNKCNQVIILQFTYIKVMEYSNIL